MGKKQNIEENKLYNAFVQSVTDYMVVISKDYKVIMANNLFKSEFGLQSGDPCFHAWKGRDRKCENCLVEKSFQDGEIHEAEEMVMMKNGRPAKMLVKSTPIQNNAGSIVYVFETATDITGKKQLKEKIGPTTGNLQKAVVERLKELQESEEKYRTIFENSKDAIFLTDLSVKIKEVNQAGVALLGFKTKNELTTSQSVTDFFEAQKDLSKFQNELSLKGFVTEFETRFVGRHGRAFDALMTSNIIAGSKGRNVGLVIIITDISKIKHAQQQIEKQNIRLSTLNAISMTVNSSLNLNEVLEKTIDKILEILESDSVRIYLLNDNKDELVLTAHKGFTENFIAKQFMKCRKVGDGLLGQTVLTGNTKVADNVLRSRDPYVDSFIEEGLKSTIYIPLASKGESVGVMCVSSHSIYQFSDDYVAFLNAIGNQIGVAVENANLYENIKTAYLELKDAQEQVIRAEKLASLGKLSATIAHEINNPLAAVLTYAKLMLKLIDRDRFNQGKLKDISRYLETMKRETARCGDIVKNLLDFSRQTKISIGTHAIEEIIDRALVLITHELEINNIRLEKQIQPGLPMVKCDFKQTQQALLNLVINASEAMSEGGLLTIRATAAEHDRFLEVVISDTGCGITDEDLKNIFEPFFTTKDAENGVGLGLSVVYGIITGHKGSVDVKSEPGKGTSFIVRLPAAYTGRN